MKKAATRFVCRTRDLLSSRAGLGAPVPTATPALGRAGRTVAVTERLSWPGPR